MRIISFFLVCAGIGCVAYSFLLAEVRYSSARLSFSIEDTEERKMVNDVPIRIKIESVDINARVSPAAVRQGKWETSDDSISFLTSSAKPGTKGNSVFYGHNWQGLFGSLQDVEIGDKIEVYTAEEGVIVYTVQLIGIVTPDQTHILDNTQEHRITLYTCIGFLDSKRLVVTGKIDEKHI